MGRERRGEKPAVRGRAGAANGERGRRRARRRGGGGALFQGGPRVGSAQRQSGAEQRGASEEQAGGPAGARRSAGGRGSSKGGRRQRAIGPGPRDPETAAAAAAAAGGAEGTPPLPAPCLRPSLLPRGPARTSLREGERWLGASPGRRAAPVACSPTRGAQPRGLEQSWPRHDALGAPPSRGCATLCPRDPRARLEAPGCGGAAPRLLPAPPLGSLPALRGGLWCLGPRERGWRGLGRDAAPPAAATLWGVLPAARTPSHSGAAPGRAGEGG